MSIAIRRGKIYRITRKLRSVSPICGLELRVCHSPYQLPATKYCGCRERGSRLQSEARDPGPWVEEIYKHECITLVATEWTKMKCLYWDDLVSESSRCQCSLTIIYFHPSRHSLSPVVSLKSLFPSPFPICDVDRWPGHISRRLPPPELNCNCFHLLSH